MFQLKTVSGDFLGEAAIFHLPSRLEDLFGAERASLRGDCLPASFRITGCRRADGAVGKLGGLR